MLLLCLLLGFDNFLHLAFAFSTTNPGVYIVTHPDGFAVLVLDFGGHIDQPKHGSINELRKYSENCSWLVCS